MLSRCFNFDNFVFAIMLFKKDLNGFFCRRLDCLADYIRLDWEFAKTSVNQNYEFDFNDIFQVLARALYETGLPATWGDGDWNGGPGGAPGTPPPGNGLFDFNDIFAALATGLYGAGPYAVEFPGASPVPAPSSMALACLSLMGTLWIRVRRRTDA